MIHSRRAAREHSRSRDGSRKVVMHREPSLLGCTIACTRATLAPSRRRVRASSRQSVSATCPFSPWHIKQLYVALAYDCVIVG